MTVRLFNDDCLKILPTLEENSIDLFLLDLPYGQTAQTWDSLIDLPQMWLELKRVMKPSAVIAFFATAKFGNSIINSNPKWFKYDLVWLKSRKMGFLSANKMPLRQHENIYIFKNELGTYNPQMTPRDKDYKHSGKRTSETHYGGVIDCKTEYKKEDGKFPTSVIDLEGTVLEYSNPSKPIHPTQKPVELLEWLIKTYSNEDDVVCDFTMGSGSTGEACINTLRHFVGVEMHKEIYEIAEARLLEVSQCA